MDNYMSSQAGEKRLVYPATLYDIAGVWHTTREVKLIDPIGVQSSSNHCKACVCEEG